VNNQVKSAPRSTVVVVIYVVIAITLVGASWYGGRLAQGLIFGGLALMGLGRYVYGSTYASTRWRRMSANHQILFSIMAICILSGGTLLISSIWG